MDEIICSKTGRKCNRRECEYTELEWFINELNEETGKCFELETCPDKAQLGYNCDLLYSDADTGEKLYIETKEVRFAVGENGKDNEILGKQRYQDECTSLICHVIDHLCSADIQDELNHFVVTVSDTKISYDERTDFCNSLATTLKDADLDVVPFTFCFEGKHGKIEIIFERKTEQMRGFKDGGKTIFAHTFTEENTIDEIFGKVTDIDLLLKLINKNLEETTREKFPETEGRKILLNILKLPNGYDIFFHQFINYMANKISKAIPQNSTAATESYLLYFCEDYKFDNDSNGNGLLMIPVIKGIFDKPLAFVEKH